MNTVSPKVRFVFELYQDGSGEHRWRLRSKRNRKIVADSAEGYVARGDARRAVATLTKCMVLGTVQVREV